MRGPSRCFSPTPTRSQSCFVTQIVRLNPCHQHSDQGRVGEIQTQRVILRNSKIGSPSRDLYSDPGASTDVLTAVKYSRNSNSRRPSSAISRLLSEGIGGRPRAEGKFSIEN